MSQDGSGINTQNMLSAIQQLENEVNAQIQSLESGALSGGSPDIVAMFTIQLDMQGLSQATETYSDILTAINTSIMSLAKATKGQ